MNEEEIREEARKAANLTKFMSNHIYDQKSYEDGFCEGMKQALRLHDVIGRSEQLKPIDGVALDALNIAIEKTGKKHSKLKNRL